METERRTYAVPDIEIRQNEDGGIGFLGHPAVFGKLSEPIFGAFVEQVASGAFSKTIQESDVRMLVNHVGVPIARTKSGTLILSEDDVGLRSEAPSLDQHNPTVVELASAMSRGDLDQMSFGFRTVRDEIDYDAKPYPVRTLLEVQLFDVSPVTFPAYPDTDAELSGLVVPMEVRSKFGLRVAIASHKTPVDSDASWDGPAATSGMPNDASTLRYCHAWFAGGDAEPDAKGSYKFPHHLTKGGPAILRGVNNAKARLPGARIPSSDRAGVEAHLNAHQEAASENGLDLGEVEVLSAFDVNLLEIIESEREGKVLSAASEEKVRAAIEALKALLDSTSKESNSYYRDVAAAEARLQMLRHSA